MLQVVNSLIDKKSATRAVSCKPMANAFSSRLVSAHPRFAGRLLIVMQASAIFPDSSIANHYAKTPTPSIIHDHMQVRRRDTHVRMSRCISNFRQIPIPRQRVTDECVPPVVDRQGFNRAIPRTLHPVLNRFRSVCEEKGISPISALQIACGPRRSVIRNIGLLPFSSAPLGDTACCRFGQSHP